MKMTFITGNPGKFEEAKLVIPSLEQADIDLPEIQDIDSSTVISHKLEQVGDKIGGAIVVEDNSLYLECLNGLPGPLIKWFLKTIGNEGLVKIANAFGNTAATAKVVIGYKNESGEIQFFEGEIEGKIVEARGENGFGWDPIFEPNGYDKTFGEMTIEEKNKISMRKVAFQKLKERLDL